MNDIISMKALIIDDNPLDLTLITNMVRQSSELEVIALSSSLEALRWCKSNDVDIVIVDCLMPSPNGIEFVYLFRKIKGNADIPIIMVTASDEKEVKYQALEIGVNFFVKKPIDSIEFFVLMNNAISMRVNQMKIQERERQLAESKKTVSESQRKLSTLMNNLPGIAYRCKNDQNWTMEFISGGCKEILGYSPEELIDNAVTSFSSLIVKEDTERVLETVQKAVASSMPYVLEYQVIDRLGHKKWLWEKGTGVYDENGTLVALEGFITDITERKEAERRFHHLAHYDSLTGLANRTLFFDRLHQAMRMAKRGGYFLALIFLDLDGFKSINDTYGHDAGDLVLKETAKRLTDNVRESDTIARMGGDEFTVLLSRIENKKSASIVAQKVLRAIAEPYIIENERCIIGASIGISIYHTGEEDADTLIKKADIAMYRSKQEGKNCFTFYTT